MLWFLSLGWNLQETKLSEISDTAAVYVIKLERAEEKQIWYMTVLLRHILQVRWWKLIKIKVVDHETQNIKQDSVRHLINERGDCVQVFSCALKDTQMFVTGYALEYSKRKKMFS